VGRLHDALAEKDTLNEKLVSLEEMLSSIQNEINTVRMSETEHRKDLQINDRDIENERALLNNTENDLSELASNTDRMDRQKQYITSFLSSVVPAAKKDISVVTTLYDTVKENSTTNLNTTKVTYLATSALSNIDSYKNINFYSVPGTVQKGEKYAEFYVDQTGLWELMLELFYIEQ